MENQCKGCCGTCKYGIYNTSAGYVCVNGDSKYVTAFVKYSHGCDKYEKNAEMSDNVNHPSHYETGKYECIDVMIETQGIEAVKNFCICNAFKYLYRHENKNGVEDVRKAKWYLGKYLELVESDKEKLKKSFENLERSIENIQKNWKIPPNIEIAIPLCKHESETYNDEKVSVEEDLSKVATIPTLDAGSRAHNPQTAKNFATSV